MSNIVYGKTYRGREGECPARLIEIGGKPRVQIADTVRGRGWITIVWWLDFLFTADEIQAAQETDRE